MATTLYTNIHLLAGATEKTAMKRGADLANLQVITNAWLLVKEGVVADYGAADNLDNIFLPAATITVDVEGRSIMPAWVDSHTHLVFAATREDEFVQKLKGKSYAEIAAAGGGILNSAAKLQAMSEDELFYKSAERLHNIIKMGTGAIEIKSGYGLTVEAELKMLRVIKRLKQHFAIPIRASFLGAHAFPADYKEDHEGYIKIIIEEMLPVIANENLADYVDVFCENGFFSANETKIICGAASRYGLRPKLHVNQLNSVGGIEAGIALNARSLDHLETLTADEIRLLGAYSGNATLLPTAAFFLRMQYQPARALIGAGAAVTIASDFNPGSSPSANMNFVAALSCIQMKMLPEEVINAGTINGAYALDLQHEVGSISKGKRANFIITKPISSLPVLFYSFGDNHIHQVVINGEAYN